MPAPVNTRMRKPRPDKHKPRMPGPNRSQWARRKTRPRPVFLEARLFAHYGDQFPGPGEAWLYGEWDIGEDVRTINVGTQGPK